MCGIAGCVSYDGDLRSHKDFIAAMTETGRAVVRMRVAKNPESTIYAGMHEVRPGQVVRFSV
jgi:hypothetical protein